MADTVEKDEDVPSSSLSDSNVSSSSSWWGSWSQGWIDTVKEKSAQTMEMVKKDLNEFVEVIQGDTSVAISNTASKIKPEDGEDEDAEEEGASNFDSIESATKVVKKGMANFLDSVSALMAVPPDDTKEEVITIPDLSPTTTHYDRKQEKIHAIQIDPGTYCNEPEGLFSEWLEVFNLDDNKQHMSNMLVQNPAVRAIYTQLVPAVVSHTMFWQRYFYQVFLLEAEEKKREEIVARANDESNEGDEVGSGWGDDEDDDEDGIEVLSSFTLPDNTADIMDYSIITSDTNDDITENTKCELIDEVDTNKTLSESQNDIAADTNEMETPENSVLIEKLHDEVIENSAHHEMLPTKETMDSPDNTENNEQVQNLPDQTIETSSEIADVSCPVEEENDNFQPNTEQLETDEIKRVSPVSTLTHLTSQENGDSSSLSSWMSIDDTIKVKKIKGEQDVKSDNCVSSADVSAESNGVVISESDLIDDSDEDFELDDDVNEFEVAKMVDEIKNMSVGGNLDDDDDWEKWE